MINVLLSTYSFHEEWIRYELEPFIKEGDKVVVVPFAFKSEWISNREEWKNAYSRKTGKFYNEIVTPFKSFGVKEEDITWLNYYEDSREDMIKRISNSQILFFTGGLPEYAVERIKRLKLDSTIKKYNHTIIGASAGALMQLDDYFVSPDEDYEQFEYFEGLGLINNKFNIEVHYDESKVQREAIKQCLKDKKGEVYAINDKGGIVIDHKDHIRLYGTVVEFTSSKN